ncbi:kinase-like domain-containing protein [Tribonema minus]|uniref:Kinase-like domain-containing protein n=1 Tax=Tribonema minus TaxID=303371 RepID=A0A836C785_9STRA|nr:kinase-like domain-containing protein [Tribonema minus]
MGGGGGGYGGFGGCGGDGEGLSSRCFDALEAWAFEQLRAAAHAAYLASPQHAQFLAFSALQARPLAEADFILFRVLGRGGFGAVNGCKRSTTGKLYAMKVMSRRHIKAKKSESMCWNERRILERVASAFVVSLKYAFTSETDLFLILDLMTGGDLGFHLSQMGTFTYEMARYYTGRIVLALDHLHTQGILYRDLKPENILLGEDGRSRISDMGLACRATPDLVGACGTRGYWAPEMRVREPDGSRKPYDFRVDWFSTGCVLYEFISGVCPFRTERAKNWCIDTIPEKDKRIDKATLEMEPEFTTDRFNPWAKDLCSHLLVKDPDRRLGRKGCVDIMLHPWFGDLDWDRLAQDQLPPPFIPNKDINAAPRRAIGSFVDPNSRKTAITQADRDVFKGWEYTGEAAFQEEVVDFLRHQGQRVDDLDSVMASSSCCSVC